MAEEEIADDIALELTRAAEAVAKATEAKSLRPLAFAIVVCATPRLMYDNTEDGNSLRHTETLIHAVNMGTVVQGNAMVRKLLETALEHVTEEEPNAV